MNNRLSNGVLTISVELDVDAARRGLAEQRQLGDAALRLQALLDRNSLPATWALNSPGESPFSHRLRQVAGHEVALLGDATWVGREAGRGTFGRELGRRIGQARGAGLDISTLVLTTSALDDHADLAIKHGIVAVRHAAASAQAGVVHPQTIRYGLWGFPVSIVMPQARGWVPGLGSVWRACAGIDRTSQRRGFFHLAIDLALVVERGRLAERALERVFGHAERRRRQGVLDVKLLSTAAATLSNLYQGAPSRSILRPAA